MSAAKFLPTRSAAATNPAVPPVTLAGFQGSSVAIRMHDPGSPAQRGFSVPSDVDTIRHIAPWSRTVCTREGRQHMPAKASRRIWPPYYDFPHSRLPGQSSAERGLDSVGRKWIMLVQLHGAHTLPGL